MDSNEIQSLLCERCYFLIINFTNDAVHIDKTEFLNLKPKDDCNFCFGMLHFENFGNELSDMRAQMDTLEYKNFKLSVNFSSLFNLLHYYWRSIFSKTKLVKNLCEIDITMLRVIFKQIFTPIVEQQLHESYSPQSNLEIVITFEFNDDFYKEINTAMKFANKNRDFKPNDDKCNMKEVIKSLQPSLIIELFKKYKLNNIASKGVLLKNFKLFKQSMFIKGNYMKLTRDIGQSPWEIKGVRVCPSSVEEEISVSIKKLFNCDDCIMSAGGREDRDVRMLGSGRPFILEIVNPRVTTVNKNLSNEINSLSNYIQVKNVELCDREYTAEIKKYEESKQKCYTCVMYCARTVTDEDITMLNQITNLALIQKTPFRVLHRRTLMDRNKMIYKINAKRVNENFLIVDVVSSAGTYIKEFIHSDLGRTKPSMVSLLQCECDILQLDVLNIIYNTESS